MRRIIRRVWHLMRARRFEREVAEELAFHEALKRQELEDGGLTASDARFAARRALGSVALAHDRARDVWVPHWLQGLGQDARLAVRSLRASPIVSAVAVFSLALGVGANTAMFSFVDSLLLRSLPVSHPERLALVSSGTGPRISYWSNGVWQQLRLRPDLFDGALAWSVTRFDLSTGGETHFVDGLWTSGSFFDVLGVPAVIGRTLSVNDDELGAELKRTGIVGGPIP